MCHLTATGQTQFKNCDFGDFNSQLAAILRHYQAQNQPAEVVHLNWMARGEPLCNPTLTETSTDLCLSLAAQCTELGLLPKFNVSTIMPRSFRGSLERAFPVITPTIYYSLYSMDPEWRRRWLPGAMDAGRALDLLAGYQAVSRKLVKIHGAFIKDENDGERGIEAMLEAVLSRGIRAEFNIVRYNPCSESQGQESPNLEGIARLISRRMPCKIIPRVGADVYASCGTFLE